MRKLTTIEIANDTMLIVGAKRPSKLIPFKGDFPLLKPWQEEAFQDDIANHPYFDELQENTKNILLKAQRLKSIEDGFKEYLNHLKIMNKFKSMTSMEKTQELSRFLDMSCLTYDSLNI